MGQCHEAVASRRGDYPLLFFLLEWLIRCLVERGGEMTSITAKSATLLQFMITQLVYTSDMSDARHRRLAL